MVGHTSANKRGRAAVVGTALAVVALGTAACGASKPTTAAIPSVSDIGTPTATGTSAAAAGLAVPGIPDPCALVDAGTIMQAAHIPSGAKAGAVPAAGGGRSCAYNAGHPDFAIVSLTPVTKAGFDTFKQSSNDTVTPVAGIGQEAYHTAKTPNVIDVFKNGFDINVYVVHVDGPTQAAADAKAVATLVAGKV